MIHKPAWLENFLAQFNWYRGDWIDVTILGAHIQIPPFNFTPGDWIEYALDTIIDYANDALAWLEDAISSLDDWIVAQIYDLQDWIEGVYTSVSITIDTLWDDISAWVSDGIIAVYDWVDDRLYAIGTEIWNTFDDIQTSFTTWFNGLDDRLSVLESLVIEIPQEVADFITSPIRWFANKIDEWFFADIFPD
jgi:phage-related protein